MPVAGLMESNIQQETLDLQYMEIYAYADLAAGKSARNKARQARQAIVVGARDWLDRWFFIYIWAGKITTTEFQTKIIETYRTYKPRVFGLEANGMQVLFGDLVREKAKIEFGQIKMLAIYQPTNVGKNFRIRTGLEPVINAGRLFLMAHQIEAKSEIQGFPTAMTKDIIDAIETCIRMAPKRPLNRRNDAELEQYASYLRSSRLPAHIIEQKLLEFKMSRE